VNSLPKVYEELRDRVRIHIKQIRKSQKKHPEYAVALLISVASEALSTLRGQAPYTVFAKELLPQTVSEEVGRSLFEAVRHGLAHRYDTALIAAGKRDVVVVVTWKKPQLHLRVLVKDWLGDGVRRPGVYLDTETMWRALDVAFRRMTRQLHNEKKLARIVIRNGRRLDQKYTVRPAREEASRWREGWAAFLGGGGSRGGALSKGRADITC